MSSPAEQRTDNATDQQCDQEQVTSHRLGRIGHGVGPGAGLYHRALREQYGVQPVVQSEQPVSRALDAAHLALEQRDLVLQLRNARIGRARVGTRDDGRGLAMVAVVAPAEPAGPAITATTVQAVVTDAPPPQEEPAVAGDCHADVHRPAVAVDDGVAGATRTDLVAHGGLLSLVSDLG